MKIPRQSERRARFLAALKDMPCFETWTTENHSEPSRVVATNNYVSMYEAGLLTVTKEIEAEPPRIRQHVRLIPRCIRRDMARQLSRRQYRVDRNLPEPR